MAGVVVEMRLGHFTYAVQEDAAKFRQPDGTEVAVKVMVAVFTDPEHGVQVVIPLPFDPPPGGMPPGGPQDPPAIDLARMLNGGKPQVIRATSMPTMPPPGGMV
jgi:hypothetical protein